MILPFPRQALERSIPERFRDMVARHRDRPAVRYDGKEVSYAALLDRALRWAALVRAAASPAPGAVVLLVPHGIEQIAAILGVLEAGDWFVALDLADPQDRLRLLAARAEAKLVLAGESTAELANEVSRGLCPFARVDPAGPDPARCSGLPVGPGALAYVYFTSGTTGEPKGVMDSHRNVLHNVLRYTNTLRIGDRDRLTLLQPSHFSGAASNVFGALLNGATLLPYDVGRDGAGAPLSRWMTRERPTIYHSVPSLFRSLCLPDARYPSVRTVRLEGDSGAPGDAERFTRHFPPDALLVNGLGTTETGICRQFFLRHGERVSGDVLPVGHAVEDMEVRVLDEAGAPVPPGGVGEIVVRSRFLALGYWRDEPRTSRSFRADRSDPALREYRTGDLGRLRHDGCLEHLGRIDLQLKVRGRWVDVAAVESRLVELPGVAEAAVTAHRGDGDEVVLAAYIVHAAEGPPTLGALRRALAASLPVHAVPAHAYALDALPLGPNAKLDRRALTPALGRPLSDPAGDAPPRDDLEAGLVAIWTQVLGRDRVGIHDSFIELGGDSLKAVQVALEIERRFGIAVPHSVLASSPTVTRLAARLRPGGRADQRTALIPLRTGGARPAVFCVHDLESDGFLFAGLASRLPENRPVYALRYPAGEPAGRLPRTLPVLAERYIEEIRAAAPRGPYALVGFCFGGVVALEIARRLRDDGERVALLAVVNVTAYDLFPLVSARARSRFRRRWGARLRYLLRKPDALRWIARRLSRAAEDIGWRMLLPTHLARLGPEAPASPALVRAVLREAFRHHVPRPHQGNLSLFLAEETLPLYADDPREAWARIATGRIEISMLPHDGYSMLAEPDVAKLAGWLGERLG